MSKYIETANFDVEKFPLDCGTLRGMQDNTAILAVLARIAAGKGTKRLILCGCESMGNGYRSEGYIWRETEKSPLTGEIIYHEEQRLYEKFLIKETAETVNVDGVDYYNLYRHREATDTTAGTEMWSAYTRLDEVSNVALKALMDAEAKARTEAVRAEADARAAADEAETDARAAADEAEAKARAAADEGLNRKISLMSGVPTGIIMLWDLDNGPIPEGWAPYYKMSGRFALGASYNNGKWDCGDEGGASTMTLKTEHMPAHKHNVKATVPAHGHGTHISRKINIDAGGSGYNVPVVPGDGEGDAYNSTGGGITVDATTAIDCSMKENSVGDGQAFSIMPPYMKLIYIIKI